MTTQVVLMNGLGIALASDSAVTAGGKVLNTSEKVFDLPAHHKVAVLSSGRAQFMGHPWEVLLSAWSEKLDTPLQSMIDYRDSLYKFLRGVLPATSELSSQEVDYIRACYFGEDGARLRALEILQTHVTPFFESKLSPEDLHIFMTNELWTEEYKARISKLITKPLIAELQEAFSNEIIARTERFVATDDVTLALAKIWSSKYWAQMDLRPSVDFAYWPEIPGFDEWVIDLLAAGLLHADYLGESNIVFVGYGAGDLFPSAAAVFFHGVLNGTLIKRFEGHLDSSADPRSAFFGQDDAIRALTLGEDAVLTSTAVQNTRKTLSDIYEQLSESTDERVQMTRDFVQQSLEKDDLADEMKRAGNENRQEPFTRAIAMSPILDLAEFAAQLVGVQAASAAMTQDNPSVGGFVDVATITHRRGFEWIRHKH